MGSLQFRAFGKHEFAQLHIASLNHGPRSQDVKNPVLTIDIAEVNSLRAAALVNGQRIVVERGRTGNSHRPLESRTTPQGKISGIHLTISPHRTSLFQGNRASFSRQLGITLHRSGNRDIARVRAEGTAVHRISRDTCSGGNAARHGTHGGGTIRAERSGNAALVGAAGAYVSRCCQRAAAVKRQGIHRHRARRRRGIRERQCAVGSRADIAQLVRTILKREPCTHVGARGGAHHTVRDGGSRRRAQVNLLGGQAAGSGSSITNGDGSRRCCQRAVGNRARHVNITRCRGKRTSVHRTGFNESIGLHLAGNICRTKAGIAGNGKGTANAALFCRHIPGRGQLARAVRQVEGINRHRARRSLRGAAHGKGAVGSTRHRTEGGGVHVFEAQRSPIVDGACSLRCGRARQQNAAIERLVTIHYDGRSLHVGIGQLTTTQRDAVGGKQGVARASGAAHLNVGSINRVVGTGERFNRRGAGGRKSVARTTGSVHHNVGSINRVVGTGERFNRRGAGGRKSVAVLQFAVHLNTTVLRAEGAAGSIVDNQHAIIPRASGRDAGVDGIRTAFQPLDLQGGIREVRVTQIRHGIHGRERAVNLAALRREGLSGNGEAAVVYQLQNSDFHRLRLNIRRNAGIPHMQLAGTSGSISLYLAEMRHHVGSAAYAKIRAICNQGGIGDIGRSR